MFISEDAHYLIMELDTDAEVTSINLPNGDQLAPVVAAKVLFFGDKPRIYEGYAAKVFEYGTVVGVVDTLPEDGDYRAMVIVDDYVEADVATCEYVYLHEVENV